MIYFGICNIKSLTLIIIVTTTKKDIYSKRGIRIENIWSFVCAKETHLVEIADAYLNIDQPIKT